MNITLVPYGGLCNRMNSIISAILLKREKNVSISVYWQNSRDCKADFLDLFQPIPEIEIIPLDSFILKPNSRRNLHLPGIIRSVVFDRQFDGMKISDDDILLTGEDLGKVYISSTNRFCPFGDSNQSSHFFIPTVDIQRLIDATLSKLNKDTVGVHIHRTDNTWAITNSPLELFIERMGIELTINPETTFFVASDDYSVKSILKDKFDEHIITYEASLQRNSLQGMKDAVVELFLLANTRLILGSSFSTYSTMASSLYNRKLEVLLK